MIKQVIFVLCLICLLAGCAVVTTDQYGRTTATVLAPPVYVAPAPYPYGYAPPDYRWGWGYPHRYYRGYRY